MTQNIEQYVEQIFKLANISSAPIDAEKLAENYFDLDFDWIPFDDVNIMAALAVAHKKIYMNERYASELAANVGLRNFTVAHELGHWVLHRHLASERLIDVDGEVFICREVGKFGRDIEREADKFATYLLMPEKFVRAEFAQINPPFTWRDVYFMAEKFRVSATAMKIRLSQHELKLMYFDRDGNCYRSREDFLERSSGQLRLF